MRVSIGILTALLMLLGAVAQSADAEQEKDKKPGRKSAKEYKGVVPEVRDTPDMQTPKGGPPTLTWPGFQLRKDGGARVFVQLTDATPYMMLREKGRYVIELQGVKVFTRNNRRPLFTQHFGTPVRSIRVRSRKDVVRVEITADTDEPPSVRDRRSGKFHYIYVDFSAPETPPVPVAPEVKDAELPE